MTDGSRTLALHFLHMYSAAVPDLVFSAAVLLDCGLGRACASDFCLGVFQLFCALAMSRNAVGSRAWGVSILPIAFATSASSALVAFLVFLQVIILHPLVLSVVASCTVASCFVFIAEYLVVLLGTAQSAVPQGEVAPVQLAFGAL